MKTLILASRSSRRLNILKGLGFSVKVKASDVDESFDPSSAPEDIVCELSRRKAQAVAERCSESDVILAADTVVVFDGVIFGKPCDEHDAFRMLAVLSGSTHDVYTGYTAVSGGRSVTGWVRTRVRFREITEDEIEHYIASGEPMDKAGAYGIQGVGGMFVEGIEGDYYNVVGLPICPIAKLLREEFGVDIFEN